MSDLKNKKYVDALWKCYKKGLSEIDGVSERELFTHLIDDAVNQIVVAERVSSKMQPVVMQPGDVEARAGLQDGEGLKEKILKIFDNHCLHRSDSGDYLHFDCWNKTADAIVKLVGQS